MAYGKSKDLTKITQSDKVLKDKAFDLFSKYAWVIPIKDKKGTSIVNVFQKITSEGRRQNKIWVDQGSDFTIILLKIF